MREAIATVFRRFDELGSARQVLLSLREDGLLLPRRRNGCPADQLGARDLPGDPRFPVQPGLCRGVRVRPHPHREARRPGHRAGAGAGAGAAARAVGGVDPRSPSRVHLLVGLRGQHRPAARQLAAAPRPWRRRPARRPRAAAGPAALRPVRADHANRLLRPTGNSPRYVCARAKQLYAGEHGCQSIGGGRLEKTVLAELFAVLEPAALTATAQALAEADAHYRQRAGRVRAGRGTRPVRGRPGAAAVRRRRAGEPVGRPHPGEGVWKTSWPRSAPRENDLAVQRARRPVALTDQELAWIATAGADVRAVFDAPTTTVRERKQLIRAVIAEIVLTVRRRARVAELRIIWQGGAVTEVSMPMTKQVGTCAPPTRTPSP